MKGTEQKLLKERHETALDILDGIAAFYRRISVAEENIATYKQIFNWNYKDEENRLDTLKRCVVRLERRYNKVMAQIITRI